MSERNFDRDMLHGCVHVSALSHACIRATPPGGVYRSTPSWTFSATKPERKSVSGDGGFTRKLYYAEHDTEDDTEDDTEIFGDLWRRSPLTRLT